MERKRNSLIDSLEALTLLGAHERFSVGFMIGPNLFVSKNEFVDGGIDLKMATIVAILREGGEEVSSEACASAAMCEFEGLMADLRSAWGHGR